MRLEFLWPAVAHVHTQQSQPEAADPNPLCSLDL